MPSPDTSAQDAPRTTDYCDICGESPQSATHEGMPGGHAWTRRVASQEAEARDLVFALRLGRGFMDALDAYTAVIRASERANQQEREWAIAESEFQRGHAAGRASEREGYAALVEALKTIRHHAEFSSPTLPLRTGWVIEVCTDALTVLEEAESAQ